MLVDLAVCNSTDLSTLEFHTIFTTNVFQIIVGIVINELQLKDIISRYDPNNLNWKREELDDWYFADHIWVGFAVSHSYLNTIFDTDPST